MNTPPLEAGAATEAVLGEVRDVYASMLDNVVADLGVMRAALRDERAAHAATTAAAKERIEELTEQLEDVHAMLAEAQSELDNLRPEPDEPAAPDAADEVVDPPGGEAG